jgi:hypothetical protein
LPILGEKFGVCKTSSSFEQKMSIFSENIFKIITSVPGTDLDQKATSDGSTGDRPHRHGGHGRPPDRGQQAKEAFQTLEDFFL